MIFPTLVPFVQDAHRAANRDELQRAYDFALSCLRQGGELQNAVAVSYYEHVFDSWDIHREVAKWLHPEVVQECWSLWEYRLEEEKLKVLRKLFGRDR